MFEKYTGMNNKMLLLGVIALSVVIALILDLIYVRVMPHCWFYPSPMAIVFFFMSLIALIAAIFLLGTPSRSRATVKEDYERMLKLLPEAEKDVFKYLLEKGGEVQQAQISKDLGLSKVRTWRIVQRLQEKGLVEVRKVKGRVLVRVKI